MRLQSLTNEAWSHINQAIDSIDEAMKHSESTPEERGHLKAMKGSLEYQRESVGELCMSLLFKEGYSNRQVLTFTRCPQRVSPTNYQRRSQSELDIQEVVFVRSVPSDSDSFRSFVLSRSRSSSYHTVS